jgi:8-oxo-dGTP diphosphatase
MPLFNVRVYGLLINEHNQVLVSDENIRGNLITKFPGGGLEIGEGTIECIKREFLEETNTKIEVLSHYYTTDFFVISAFNNVDQIISIYYLVKNITPIGKEISEFPFDFKGQTEPPFEALRWINLESIKEDDFSLAIDKVVVGMLKM